MDATPHPPRPGPEAAPAEAAGAPDAAAPAEAAGGVPGGPDAGGVPRDPAADGVPGGPDAGGAPLPLGVEREPTGHGPVDALLARLADADHLAADGHLAVYEDVHRGLRDTLAALDAHPQPGPPYDHRS
ncbi:hypothetical protein [Streptomyces sp. NPDC095602]|uniref:hypothetical protein n=1 Tax=Streptomyces sp. NPDC095602 TaxID=3155819 RepID=UPI00331A3105